MDYRIQIEMVIRMLLDYHVCEMNVACNQLSVEARMRLNSRGRASYASADKVLDELAASTGQGRWLKTEILPIEDTQLAALGIVSAARGNQHDLAEEIKEDFVTTFVNQAMSGQFAIAA